MWLLAPSPQYTLCRCTTQVLSSTPLFLLLCLEGERGNMETFLAWDFSLPAYVSFGNQVCTPLRAQILTIKRKSGSAGWKYYQGSIIILRCLPPVSLFFNQLIISISEVTYLYVPSRKHLNQASCFSLLRWLLRISICAFFSPNKNIQLYSQASSYSVLKLWKTDVLEMQFFSWKLVYFPPMKIWREMPVKIGVKRSLPCNFFLLLLRLIMPKNHS